MHIPGNLPAPLSHAESRPRHRLEPTSDVHHSNNQILLRHKIPDSILSGKIQIDIRLPALLCLLQQLLDRAFIDKYLKALCLQPAFQLLRRRHLILIHQSTQPRRLQPLHIDNHNPLIPLRRQRQHILVLILHQSDSPVRNLPLHSRMLRAPHNLLCLRLRRHQLRLRLPVQSHMGLQSQDSVQGIAQPLLRDPAIQIPLLHGLKVLIHVIEEQEHIDTGGNSGGHQIPALHAAGQPHHVGSVRQHHAVEAQLPPQQSVYQLR